jgi:hypothetical protein
MLGKGKMMPDQDREQQLSSAGSEVFPLTPTVLIEKMRGRLGRQAIYAAIRTGEIPSTKVGSRIFISPSWARETLGIV